jgi:hypothetical protein
MSRQPRCITSEDFTKRRGVPVSNIESYDIVHPHFIYVNGKRYVNMVLDAIPPRGEHVEFEYDEYLRPPHFRTILMEKWDIRVNDVMTHEALPRSDGETAGG